MTEDHKATMSSDEIRCTATYKNYRKFSVSTDEEIEKPPTKKPPGVKGSGRRQPGTGRRPYPRPPVPDP